MPINFKKVTFNERIGVSIKPDMVRQDLTMKSNQGYLGQIKDNKGYTMTEQSIDVDIDGKKVLMPLLVPGLNNDEIAAIRANESNDNKFIQSAYKKAEEHGKQRIKEGKNPFFEDKPQSIALESDEVPIVANQTSKDVEINNKSVIDYAYDKLLSTEGVTGDTASNVATGKRGLTTKLYNSLKDKYNNQKMTQEEASKIYLQEAYDSFSKIEGFNKLTQDEQISILDNAYNLGYENMQGYKNFMTALKDGTDKDAIFKNLLDTAKVEGKSSKGVAKRRAEAYNVGNPEDPITRVEQTANGIIYYKGDKEYFKFNAPKSEASKVGIIDIVSD